ncbi:hypothetical protein DL93DRAFT_1324764 [Clavulina sp. PMI_390]|nr:hypothetical protein DL93DRAFT_1324764 [Clavulina sp. PMI_390]
MEYYTIHERRVGASDLDMRPRAMDVMWNFVIGIIDLPKIPIPILFANLVSKVSSDKELLCTVCSPLYLGPSVETTEGSDFTCLGTTPTMHQRQKREYKLEEPDWTSEQVIVVANGEEYFEGGSVSQRFLLVVP